MSGLIEIGRDVAHLSGDPAPRGVVEFGGVEFGRLILGEGLHGVRERGAPLVVVLLDAVQADDLEIVRQEVAAGEIIERGHEQTLGEIASRAEDDQRAGRGLGGGGRAVVFGWVRDHKRQEEASRGISVCRGWFGFVPPGEIVRGGWVEGIAAWLSGGVAGLTFLCQPSTALADSLRSEVVEKGERFRHPGRGGRTLAGG